MSTVQNNQKTNRNRLKNILQRQRPVIQAQRVCSKHVFMIKLQNIFFSLHPNTTGVKISTPNEQYRPHEEISYIFIITHYISTAYFFTIFSTISLAEKFTIYRPFFPQTHWLITEKYLVGCHRPDPSLDLDFCLYLSKKIENLFLSNSGVVYTKNRDLWHPNNATIQFLDY